MAARNPSPPPITGEEADVLNSDAIGNTVFSKRWVLRTLFNLTEAIKNSETTPNADGMVDDSLDTELCKLWDMSMNSVRSIHVKLLASNRWWVA